MKIQLLEIGPETEQLSACTLSLLLGVHTPTNQIDGFLKFARQMLQVDHAILTFKNEPYIWYSTNQVFKAFRANPNARLDAFFQGQQLIEPQHPQYANFVQHIASLGIEAARLIALDLLKTDGESIGQLLLFDHREEAFSLGALPTVAEFAAGLVRYIELKVDYASLKELYEQQSALNFSKTKFFQIIAHDLRAPFHGLLGFSEVLAQERETLDDSSIQNIADYLFDTAQSTYNLLESLLNWAMAEGGRFVYHPINFELKQSIKIVCDVLKSLAIKKNIELIDQVEEGIKVYADINMITSVIQNLVSNALKFTFTDGTGKVILRAEQTETSVDIYIQDTGLGMTAQQLETLFEPKLTVSFKGTAGEKGIGLGLVLCKRFVDLNHGQIVVESKEGVGTTFKVSLPIATSSHQVLSKEALLSEKT